MWWDGGAGPGGFRGDDDVGGVPVCPLPHRLCQQHWPPVHHSLHQVGKARGESTPALSRLCFKEQYLYKYTPLPHHEEHLRTSS